MINVNAGYPPMDNELVRRAVAMSIDREALAEISLGGAKGEGTTSLPIPPSNFASDPRYAGLLQIRSGQGQQLLKRDFRTV